MGLTISGYDSDSISTLFSSLSTSSSSSSSTSFDYSLLSEYNSIKSGNYYKLLKNYYSSNSSTDSTDDSTSSAEELAKEKSAATDLYSSANALLKKGTDSLFEKVDKTDEDGNVSSDYDVDAIYDAVSSFVSDYNTMVNVGADSSVTGVLTSVSGMTGLASANSSLLSSVGITIGSNNKLTIDEDKFKASDMSTVKSLFNTQGGFGYQVATKASMANSYIVSEASNGNYTSTATVSLTDLTSSFSQYI